MAGRTAHANGIPRGMTFRERVLAQADGVARLYLAGEELGQPATREQKEFIEGIVAADYDGRTVVELLQNGHGAHDRHRADGALEFLLDQGEGEHGVLYVANGGNPIGHQDFTSMCRIAMSNKRPDQGIGNKGVGFKSVLQLSDSPEVYSVAVAGRKQFDGYCCRFARRGDFDDLAARVAPDREGFADDLRENVASLKVPVPLDVIPPSVSDFAARGFSTVVRLELRSPNALQCAMEQLDELTSSVVPFHLFLERVATISIRQRDPRGNEIQQVLTRTTRPLGGPPAVPIEEVTLQDDSAYLVLRRTVPEAVMRATISRSRHEGGLSSGWDQWEGDGQVTVALARDTAIQAGRLFTFLPMGENATAPLPAFVNAPFFARLDRRSLDESAPLNDLLLAEVAALCAEAVILASRGEIDLPAELVVDLICWQKTALPRLQAVLEQYGAKLEDLDLLPALGGTSHRVTMRDACLWSSRVRRFTAKSVAASGVENLVNPDLDEHRRQRLLAVAEILGCRLLPCKTELVSFAEAYATALATEPFEPHAWAELYDDLAIEIVDGTALHGRLVLIDEHEQLLAAGEANDGGRAVFFARPSGDGTGSVRRPPEVIRDRLAFVSPAIPWLNAERRRRLGRDWLETHGLVRDYRTDAVLTLTGDAMRTADPADDRTLSACLRFAFDIWRSARREVGADALAQARLLLPTVSGWLPAAETYFSPGWGGATVDVDRAFARLIEWGSQSSEALMRIGAATLRLPDDVLVRREEVDDWRRFLEMLGARHGLNPLYVPARAFRLIGHLVATPLSAPDFDISVPGASQQVWRTVAAKWPRRAPSFQSVPYDPTSDVAVLPGQQDWKSFDAETRRVYAELVLRGLDTWADTALEFHYGRPSDGVRVAWPTFISAFLATAEWIPQTTPGQRTTITLMAPDRAWWLREAETPDYMRAQPGALRAIATPRVVSRLAQVGVRFWDDPSSARGRLDELTDLVDRQGLEERGQVTGAIRRAYEDAWRDLVAQRGVAPRRVVVARQGRLVVSYLDECPETVYFADEARGAQERMLRHAPVLRLPLRDPRLAKQVQALLVAEGVTCLRSTAAAKVVVTVDGVPANEASRRPLHEVSGSWLSLLVLGVMEFHYRGFPPVSAAQLSRAAQRLTAVSVVGGESVLIELDGCRLDDAQGAHSFLLEVNEEAQVVVAGVDTSRSSWALLQASSGALAELVGLPAIADGLRLVLIDLERRCHDRAPTPPDLADVLGVSPSEVEALAVERATWRSDLSALIPVLACVDLEAAEELKDQAGRFETRESLEAWLTLRFAEKPVDIGRLVALADRGDLLEAVRQLGVNLSEANAALRALGLPPLHNRDGHARQLTAYLQQQRSRLHDQLRDRFLGTVRHGHPLEEYVRLRDFPGLIAIPPGSTRTGTFPSRSSRGTSTPGLRGSPRKQGT